jgi:hypothetical protein
MLLVRRLSPQAPRALTFGGHHLNDLAPASDQIGEKSCHLVRHLPQLRLEDAAAEVARGRL